jgi:hypothetical protein
VNWVLKDEQEFPSRLSTGKGKKSRVFILRSISERKIRTAKVRPGICHE